MCDRRCNSQESAALCLSAVGTAAGRACPALCFSFVASASVLLGGYLATDSTKRYNRSSSPSPARRCQMRSVRGSSGSLREEWSDSRTQQRRQRHRGLRALAGVRFVYPFEVVSTDHKRSKFCSLDHTIDVSACNGGYLHNSADLRESVPKPDLLSS